MQDSNEIVGRRWGAVALAMLLALGGAACGGGSEAVDITGGTSSDDGGDGRADRSAGDDGGDDGATTKKKSGASTGAAEEGREGLAAQGSETTAPAVSGPTPTIDVSPMRRPGSKGQLEMEAALEETCVRPGGRQKLIVETRPGSGVSFDSIYPDGKTGMMPGHYGGGGAAQVGDSGRWTSAWVVGPGAPAGTVQVNVAATLLDWGSTATSLYFTVADAPGACP